MLIDLVVLGKQNAQRARGRARQGRLHGRGLVVFARDAHERDVEKKKVEPLPASLSTPISPPISPTNCLQIARPRPVPP